MDSFKILLLLYSVFCSHSGSSPVSKFQRSSLNGNNPPIAFRGDDVRRNTIQTQNFWRDVNYKWPKGVIPYVISPKYSSSDKQIVLNAMAEWQQKTCVRFILRTSSHRDYVEITPEDGTSYYCYSYVGRQGGRQFMKMYGECLRHAAMVHELGHVIGFNHEQQRPDRDDFITVHLENVDPAYHYTYDKFSSAQVNNMGTPYDYSSVMHYPFFAFAKTYDESRPAMTLKDGSINAIRREAEKLSPVDIKKVQVYYNNCK
ncbi:zinc metalloproteinase nas-8 [Folsomia candida]|uniref:zinc metalloproteinase nas-8 n=1 Tax=Folsomia candida TaxID=158441 RepID=UPI000B906F7A|nr:zinc metalloproteinase nas-8 [Folsomia candida]